jgi:peptide/nickel transport system substrate-binding protein
MSRKTDSAALIVLSVLLITMLAACSSGQDTADERGSIVLSSNKPGVRLDPHLDVQWEVLYILSAVYETLVYQNADGTTVPGLASDWQVADDGMTYVFDLRKDVIFHDGTPFNAAAVKFNFERILSLGPRSLKSRSLLPSFESINVLDEHTLEVRLNEPNSFFLFGLSLPYLGMVSPAAVQKWGDEYHQHQSGTGPFMFQDYLVGDRFTLVRYEEYDWAPAIYNHDGPAFLEKITWHFLAEPSTRAPALLAGDVDVAFDLLPTDAQYVTQSTSHFVSTANLTGQPAFWYLNTQLSPTDDIRVRQAILHGADMPAAVKAIKRGFNRVADGPLASVTPEYSSKLEGMYPHDRKRAISLLEQAGWLDDDGDGIREKDGKPLVVLMSMASWGQSKSFSELLYSQLKDIGIELQIEMMDFGVQVEAGQRGRKNMLFMGGSGYSAFDTLKPFFHSENTESGFAWAKFQDPELDRLLDDAVLLTNDPARRNEMYERAQMMIMEEALILPIYDYALLIGVNSKVKGLSWRSIGLVPTFYEMYLDESR